MPIEVVSKKLDKEECKDLARITIASRKGTPLESTKDLDTLSRDIEKLAADENTKILTALDDEGRIVGWISYYVGIPLMAFIESFLPVVDKDQDSERIAVALIEGAKLGALESNHNRLEIELKLATDKHREYSESLLKWYRNAGFQFAAEEAHMTLDISEIELPEVSTPEGYTVSNFSSAGYEMLENAGLRTFRESIDALFLSLNDAEQEVTMQYFFGKSRPFVEDASLILERDKQIAGFVITRLINSEADIGPIGIVPEARGKGLGNYLLVEALKGAKDAGINAVCLDVSIANQPARNLYEKHGFKNVLSKQFYYWTP